MHTITLLTPRSARLRSMTHDLTGKRVAFLVADKGTDHAELVEPMRAVTEAGGEGVLMTMKRGKVTTKSGDNLAASEFDVQLTFADASSADYDAVVVPGGTIGADHLRADAKAVAFVKEFVAAGKPVASICHGPWLLVEADVLGGRKLTSSPNIKTDLRNAGGIWTDEEVVVDRGLITSRGPKDLPAFNKALLEHLS